MPFRTARTLLALGGVGILGACAPDLAVTNPNQADITRALARPADVENLLAGGFNQVVNATTGAPTENLNTSLQVMSFENYSGLANFNMGPRGALPRTPVLNFENNPGSAATVGAWNSLQRTARSSVIALERLDAEGFTLGSDARNLRARAYGQFVLGLAHGYLAASYDSGTVVRPGGDPVPPLVAYDSVARFALLMLDSAVINGASATAASEFPLPPTWLNATVPITQQQFVRIVRSLRARIRTMVARTPAERAAIPWAQVIADVNNGITEDLLLNMNPAQGWTQSWVIQHYVGPNWHVMTPFIIGMADSTGAQYTTWLNQPLLNRTPFLIRTVDRRFPRGDTRAEQNANSAGGNVGTVQPTGQYFRNRIQGDDGAAADGTWGFSFYDHARFQAFQNAARIGSFPHITLAEMNGLLAEGLIRTGDIAQAAQVIDRTRVSRGGLPALTGVVTSATQEVPGGSACVPRVPVRTGTTFTTRCGNILEAMKWEKRMETAFINYGAWYFDMRGWGDLAEGTPIHFPIPWQEFQTRVGRPSNVGGVGQPGGAPVGTYGF